MHRKTRPNRPNREDSITLVRPRQSIRVQLSCLFRLFRHTLLCLFLSDCARHGAHQCQADQCQAHQCQTHQCQAHQVISIGPLFRLPPCSRVRRCRAMYGHTSPCRLPTLRQRCDPAALVLP